MFLNCGESAEKTKTANQESANGLKAELILWMEGSITTENLIHVSTSMPTTASDFINHVMLQAAAVSSLNKVKLPFL